MDKIVQGFDAEAGQVYKYEHVQPEVQVAVDWPYSVGIEGDIE
jgi:hypothetical protein